MTPRERRPAAEQGPVDWGTQRRPTQTRPAQGRPGRTPRTTVYQDEGTEVLDDAQTAAFDAADPAAGPATGPDWGVGRGAAPAGPTPGERARTPWPEAVRRQRLAGIAFALTGLVLATWSAMNLAKNADAGHLWVPPWLVVVLAGAGLVSAAGYLAWAGGTAVRGESERWKPTVVDAAAGLTVGTVSVTDPHRLLDAGSSAVKALGGSPAYGAPGRAGAAGHAEGLADAGGPPGRGAPDGASSTTLRSGPKPIMGTSTFDLSSHAPAGVAGAVGGFMLAAAIVCAVIALVLGPPWLLGTVALAIGGIVAIRLAGDWLGHV